MVVDPISVLPGVNLVWKMVPNGHLERAGDMPVARITGYTRQEERRRG